MIELKSVPFRSPSVVTRKSGDEYILVPVTDNIADMDSVYTLNETGAFIWDQINGHRTVSDIINNLTEEFDTNEETAKTDVLYFLEKMEKFLILK